MILYRERNIERAAQQVPMSAQGLGKAIRNLEKELGVPLFRIEGKRERIPTSYADALATFFEHLHKEYDRLENEFGRIRETEQDS